jgi:catechol 2,3-dioxygenase-like lactoylglutathione lyase family enzyme
VLAHVVIRARDLHASEHFYRTVLAAIDVAPTLSSERLVGFDEFLIVGADPEHPPTSALHTGFVAPTREHVDAFWRAGIAAGYEDDGGPGERTLYGADYYGAFLRDPDGNSVEAVHHGDTRRGPRRCGRVLRDDRPSHRPAPGPRLGRGRPIPRSLGDVLARA